MQNCRDAFPHSITAEDVVARVTLADVQCCATDNVLLGGVTDHSERTDVQVARFVRMNSLPESTASPIPPGQRRPPSSTTHDASDS